MTEPFQISRHRRKRIIYSRKNKLHIQEKKKDNEKTRKFKEKSLPDVEKVRERLPSPHFIASYDSFQINNNLEGGHKDLLKQYDLENVSPMGTEAFYKTVSLGSFHNSRKSNVSSAENVPEKSSLSIECLNRYQSFNYCEEEPPIIHMKDKKKILAVEMRTRRFLGNGDSQVELSLLHPVTFNSIPDKDLPRKIRIMKNRVRSGDDKPLPLKRLIVTPLTDREGQSQFFSIDNAAVSEDNIVCKKNLNPRRNLMQAFEECELERANKNQIESADFAANFQSANASPKRKLVRRYFKKTSTPKNWKNNKSPFGNLQISPISGNSDTGQKSGTVNSSEIHVTYSDDSNDYLFLEETNDESS